MQAIRDTVRSPSEEGLVLKGAADIRHEEPSPPLSPSADYELAKACNKAADVVNRPQSIE
jgi:hypothetical protein